MITKAIFHFPYRLAVFRVATAGAFLGKPAKIRQRKRTPSPPTTLAGAAQLHPYGLYPEIRIPRAAKASKHHLYSATSCSTTESVRRWAGSTSQV